MANLDEKRARLEAEHQRRQKRRKIVLGSLAVVVVIAIAAVILSTQEAVPGFDSKYSIGKAVKYPKDQSVAMTEVKPEVAGGQVKLSLQDLEKDKILYAMYDAKREIGNGQVGLPIMAYLTPAGRVTVAVSFCEPCYSRKFHVEDEILVCDTCGTRWSLADLSGIGGGCTKYPPHELKYTVDKSSGQIIVAEADLKNWNPRDYDPSTTMGAAKN